MSPEKQTAIVLLVSLLVGLTQILAYKTGKAEGAELPCSGWLACPTFIIGVGWVLFGVTALVQLLTLPFLK